jgi:hypothetical protein
VAEGLLDRLLGGYQLHAHVDAAVAALMAATSVHGQGVVGGLHGVEGAGEMLHAGERSPMPGRDRLACDGIGSHHMPLPAYLHSD